MALRVDGHRGCSRVLRSALVAALLASSLALSLAASTYTVDGLVAAAALAEKRASVAGTTSNSAVTPKREPRRHLNEVGQGYWFAVGSEILDESGRVVKFSGVNWNGFDSSNCVADGLWARGMDDYLDQMVELGFNLIRLNFATSCMGDAITPADGAIDFQHNPGLEGLTSLEIMDQVILGCRARGIKVILSNSRVDPALPPDFGPDAGIWFNLGSPERVWLDNWQLLASRYVGERTVIGVDLFNEPHRDPSHPDITWEDDGVNEPYNWRTAAKRAADVVQAVNPDLLIFVQGLDGDDCWWGANLRPVAFYPLKLNIPYKLVYSIHDYGPLVKDGQAWQYDPKFPANLPAYWDDVWGFVVDQGIAPVWVGEWGSKAPLGQTDELSRREMQWLAALKRYIRAKSLSWTWFTWGPNSHDTGGILDDDWQTANPTKLQVIAPVMHPDFAQSPGELPYIPPRHGPLIVYAPANATGISATKAPSGSPSISSPFSSSSNRSPFSDYKSAASFNLNKATSMLLAILAVCVALATQLV